MPSVSAWSQSCKKYSQDAYALSPYCAVIADGVTPLPTAPEGDHSSVTDYALQLVTAIAAEVDFISDGEDMLAAIRYGLSEMQSRWEHRDIQMFSTLSVTAWNDNAVYLATLGDSPSFTIDRSGRVTEFSDPAYENYETTRLDFLVDYYSNGDTDSQALKHLNDRIARERKALNSQDGSLWLASPHSDPEDIVEHMAVTELPYSEVDTLTLMTDGALNLAEKFHLIDQDRLVTHATANTMDCLYRDSIVLQKSDPSRRRYPRLSDFDDATLIRIIF